MGILSVRVFWVFQPEDPREVRMHRGSPHKLKPTKERALERPRGRGRPPYVEFVPSSMGWNHWT
jgi:hypothetical protein